MPNDLVEPGGDTLSGARSRDLISGILLLVLGAAVVYTAQGYNLGTLTRMGPGFVPAALGVILVLVGLVLLASTMIPRRQRPAQGAGTPAPIITADPMAEPAHPATSQLRGWICICLGVLVFAGLAEHTGLLPATLASVFVTALGDRENTLRDAVLLAVGMAVGAVVVFWWGLGVLLPLVEWNFG